MQNVKMFMFNECPFCQKAQKFIDELCSENENYRQIKIEKINEKEQPEVADAYDYYYVPTFFVNEVKVHEGAINKEEMEEILIEALSK